MQDKQLERLRKAYDAIALLMRGCTNPNEISDFSHMLNSLQRHISDRLAFQYKLRTKKAQFGGNQTEQDK